MSGAGPISVESAPVNDRLENPRLLWITHAALLGAVMRSAGHLRT